MDRKRVIKTTLTIAATFLPFGLVVIGSYYGYKKYKKLKEQKTQKENKSV